jgi:predicted membrane protein
MKRKWEDAGRRSEEATEHDIECRCSSCSVPRRHGFGTAILGLGVLTLGAILLLDNFGIIRGEDFYEFWPVFLILIGVSHLVRPKGSRRVFAGLVWIAIGGIVLLSNLGYIAFEIWDLWPVVLLIIGGSLVLKPFRRRQISVGENANVFEATAILGGASRRITASNFQGGDVTAVMGGCEIDLRDCGSEGGPAEINTFAFWGGVEIRVPPDWEVQVKGTAVLGAYEDKTRTAEGEGRKVLTVTGMAIMGGVEINN